MRAFAIRAAAGAERHRYGCATGWPSRTIDGVTTNVRDMEKAAGDATHANEMGFGGKLLIHPAQVNPVRAAFRPGAAVVDWARRVVEASADGGAVTVDGAMVDAPVVARARRILDRERELA